MKPKQLANVLIKILGLSMCAHSVSPILNALATTLTAAPSYGSSYRTGFLYYFVAGLIPAAVGIFLILKSQLVTDNLFKDEAE